MGRALGQAVVCRLDREVAWRLIVDLGEAWIPRLSGEGSSGTTNRASGAASTTMTIDWPIRSVEHRPAPFCRQILLTALGLGVLSGCDSGPHVATEKDRFNVYFYYPADSRSDFREEYLGEVTGISQCQRTAGGFASSKNMTRSTGWSYICCRIANGSSCYDKHK